WRIFSRSPIPSKPCTTEANSDSSIVLRGDPHLANLIEAQVSDRELSLALVLWLQFQALAVGAAQVSQRLVEINVGRPADEPEAREARSAVIFIPERCSCSHAATSKNFLSTGDAPVTFRASA